MLWNKPKPIRNIFSYCYYSLVFFIKRVYERIIHCFWEPAPIPMTIMDESEQYVEKQKKRFLEKVLENTIDKKKWNGNIDPVCYSLETFQETVLPENNTLEIEWKRRIMVENTPRGNVIMYYDIFKNAFAYASDQYIPYNILNACAMKYVITFRCIDFFMDSTILPEDIISPFSLLQNEMESKKKEDIESKKKDLGISFSNAPFAKLKSYSANPKKEDKVGDVTVSESKEKKSKAGNMIKYSNNFRNLGKISNVSFLLKPKKIHPGGGTFADNNPLLASFDYLSYKKSLLLDKKIDLDAVIE